MNTVLYTIIIVLLIIYGFKAYQNYQPYKNSILPILFPNYLEFFWRMSIRKDASYSSYLHKYIGTHKLCFATIENKQHQITSKFVLVFYNRGISIIEYLDYDGTYSGSDDERSWIIKNKNQKIRITNPVNELHTYKNRIQKALPETQIASIIALSNQANIEKIQSQQTICHYEDIFTCLNNTPCENILTEQEITNNFNTFNKVRQTLS